MSVAGTRTLRKVINILEDNNKPMLFTEIIKEMHDKNSHVLKDALLFLTSIKIVSKKRGERPKNDRHYYQIIKN